MPDLYIDEPTTITPKPQVNAAQPGEKPSQPTPTSPSTPVDVTQQEPHVLASFHEQPEGITLPNQADDEQIILFLRRHYITNIPWQTATVIFVMLPLLAFAFLPLISLPFSIPPQYTLVFLLFYYLIVFGYAFINFVVWFYNVGIVSNKRLIDIDINGISSKDVAATDLQDILDINYTQSGFQENLFDFGDVHIETEAIKPNFEFLKVPHPARVTEIISSMIEKK